MITLKDVSTEDLIYGYLSGKERFELNLNVITNYYELGEFLRKNPQWENSDISKKYFILVDKINSLPSSFIPNIYNIPIYEDYGLHYNDKLVFGSSLILESPTSTNRYLSEVLKDVTIEKIKFGMTHVDFYLKNCFEHMRYMHGRNAVKVLKGLEMYNQQIERQAQETSRRDINLFDYMLEERKARVNKEITEIIVWLIQNTSEKFVWGELTETQKKKYISAITRDFLPDLFLKNNLIDIIARYVTMSEVEEGLTKGETLKRFIIK